MPCVCGACCVEGKESGFSLSWSARAGSSWGHCAQRGRGPSPGRDRRSGGRAPVLCCGATVGSGSGKCWPCLLPSSLQCHAVAFQGMKVFFVVVAAVYVLYLLFLVVRACSELRHMPYVGERHFTRAQCEVVREEWLEGEDPETVPLPRAGARRLDGHSGPCGRSLGQRWGGLRAGSELGPGRVWRLELPGSF